MFNIFSFSHMTYPCWGVKIVGGLVGRSPQGGAGEIGGLIPVMAHHHRSKDIFHFAKPGFLKILETFWWKYMIMQCYDIHCVPFGTITAPKIYFILPNQVLPRNLGELKKTSSQASKLRLFETTTYRRTGVKCRATSVAKKGNDFQMCTFVRSAFLP